MVNFAEPRDKPERGFTLYILQRHQPKVTGRAAARQQIPPWRSPLARRAAGLLGELFPAPAERAPRRVPRILSAVIVVNSLALGVLVMLMRVPSAPFPAWDGIYGEDLTVFLVQALQQPWHLLVPYAGYIELVPRLIAQFVSYLPLRDAAVAFAITGALVTAGCALFIFHASAGHVRSPVLRLALALSVMLLPVAQLEIADSGVNTPWYLLFALFWAVLWRPGTRSGMAGAAAVGFFTAASTTTSAIFAPLLLARAIALPRLREHAVTAGWAAGCALQLPYVLFNLAGRHSRAGHTASPGHALAFYGHGVVLPALGWHLAWRLQSVAGRNGATAIIGAILAAVFAWALITQRGHARVFVAAALITGFAFATFSATLTGRVTTWPVTERYEAGSRYTTLPIFLIEAAAIVAVDSFIRHRQLTMRTAAAVMALAGVLSVGWVTDFRYQGNRSNADYWPPAATVWHACQHKPGGFVYERVKGTGRAKIPCASLHRLCRCPPVVLAGSGVRVRVTARGHRGKHLAGTQGVAADLPSGRRSRARVAVRVRGSRAKPAVQRDVQRARAHAQLAGSRSPAGDAADTARARTAHASAAPEPLRGPGGIARSWHAQQRPGRLRPVGPQGHVRRIRAVQYQTRGLRSAP